MQFSDIFPLTKKRTPKVPWSQKWVGTIPEGDCYGVPTGPRNGIWVLDLDRKKGKDGVASLREYALALDPIGEIPDTWATNTPSGGMHIYFKWNDARPIRNRTGVLGPMSGIDVRGQGGFVCAGGPYKVTCEAPIVEAPEWLYRLVEHDATTEKVPAVSITPEHPDWAQRLNLAREFLDAAEPCVSGEGGQKRLWKISLRLSRTYELPPETSWALFEERYNARCVPPWEKWEAVRTFERAATEGVGPTGIFPLTTAPWGVSPPESAPEDTPEDAPEDAPEDWRQRKNPGHKYVFDMAWDLGGAEGGKDPKAENPKELTKLFIGPGAYPLWRGVWQYDVFRRRLIAVNPPMTLDAETIGLSEADLAKVQVWCVCQGVKANLEAIRNAITVAAKSAEFHPVRDYLDALPTVDPKSAEQYFENLAQRLWNGTPLENEMLKRQAVAAVRRIRCPGTKVDEMLILYGEQGYNKSRFLAKLFGEFFSDQIHADWMNKDASDALQGVWGVEVAELTWARTEQAARKAFLSRTFDRYRAPYGRGTLQIDRQCVFFGSTNDEEFLADPTGARRFNVVHVLRPIDLDACNRDEFWAAANALEKAKYTHFFDRITERNGEELEALHAAHAETDPWDDLVEKYLEAQKSAGKEYITAVEVLTLGIALPTERQTRNELKRVQSILRRMLGASKVKRFNKAKNGTKRVYFFSPEKVPEPEKVPGESAGGECGPT